MKRSTFVVLSLAAGVSACSSVGIGVGIGVPIGRGGVNVGVGGTVPLPTSSKPVEPAASAASAPQ